jgi:hypothetical protein
VLANLRDDRATTWASHHPHAKWLDVHPSEEIPMLQPFQEEKWSIPFISSDTGADNEGGAVDGVEWTTRMVRQLKNSG